MILQRNLSVFLRAIRASRNLSVAVFARQLGIARASLQSLLQGKGNPRLNTVEYLAEQLHIRPEALVFCTMQQQSVEATLLLRRLLDMMGLLPEEKQYRFVSLLSELILQMEPKAQEHG